MLPNELNMKGELRQWLLQLYMAGKLQQTAVEEKHRKDNVFIVLCPFFFLTDVC